MPGMNGTRLRPLIAGEECHATAIHAKSVATSRAVARAILPVSGALFTGRIARATFRVGVLRLTERHSCQALCTRILI